MAGVFDLELHDEPADQDDLSDEDCIEVEDRVEVGSMAAIRRPAEPCEYREEPLVLMQFTDVKNDHQINFSCRN